MKNFVKRLLLAVYLYKRKPTYVIALMGMLMALSIVVNVVEPFKFADTQFSFTIAAMAFVGFAAGPVAGFVIGFFGDLVGFLINSGGYAYYPWVGISTGLFAFFAGLISMRKANKLWVSYVKIAVYAVVTFVVCTIFINSSFMYLTYYKGTLGFFGYVWLRVFVQFQFLNSLFSYAIIFIMYTVIKKVGPLGFLFDE